MAMRCVGCERAYVHQNRSTVGISFIAGFTPVEQRAVTKPRQIFRECVKCPF